MAKEHRGDPDATDVVLAFGEVAVLDVGSELARGDREAGSAAERWRDFLDVGR